MPGRRSQKTQELAKFLKDHQVERTSGQCPMGCGRPISNGGDALIFHLGKCPGSKRSQNNRRQGRRAV